MIYSFDHPDLQNILVSGLEQGQTGILPCDTIYGLVGIAPDTENRLTLIKHRDQTKQFLMLIPDPAVIREYSDIPLPKELAKFWPGPLTILFPLKGRQGSIGFRIPSDLFLLSMLEKLKKPLYSTSVNISGKEHLWKIKDIILEFEDKTDFIVDRGDMRNTLPSTIIDIGTTPWKLVRQGAIIVPNANPLPDSNPLS
ncbi:MAG: Sua5/YciO/YrdC/YwlC family protein [Spirochaetaceae bacterium]|nr:MAG: Sua5/YciO/YrdC/YwlC family protein [Spirochaetaceae bacterium]